MPFYFSLQGNGVNRTILFFFGLFVLKLTFFWPFCVFTFFCPFDLNVKSYPTVNPTVSCHI